VPERSPKIEALAVVRKVRGRPQIHCSQTRNTQFRTVLQPKCLAVSQFDIDDLCQHEICDLLIRRHLLMFHDEEAKHKTRTQYGRLSPRCKKPVMQRNFLAADRLYESFAGEAAGAVRCTIVVPSPEANPSPYPVTSHARQWLSRMRVQCYR
jgi:hypothetical protein